MCYSLFKGLQEEHYHASIIERINPETEEFEIPVGRGVRPEKETSTE
jgi:choline/glycine/proline betaine transport protein